MRRNLSPRRFFAFVHLWAGLILGIPLALLGLTGSLLVFEHDIDRWTNPAFYQASEGAPRPVAEIIAAAQRAGGEGLVPGAVTLPDGAGEPAIVRLLQPGRGGPGAPGSQVFVDPVSLKVLGSREQGAGLLRQAFMLHANLMIRGDRTGREIIGWIGVVMLGLALTGLYIWWPRNGRWKQAFLVKRATGTYRFNRDLHGAAGIWGLAVLIVVSFSGIYLAFPQPLGAAITGVFPGRDLRAAMNGIRVRPAPGSTAIDADSALALARESLPDAEPRTVFLPGRPDQPVRIGMARAGAWDGAPPVQVFVDPFAGRVIEIRDPRTYTIGETITAWQHALHEGSGLGPVWKLLVFAVGFLPLLFVVTGLTMWLRKRRQKRDAIGVSPPLATAASGRLV